MKHLCAAIALLISPAAYAQTCPANVPIDPVLNQLHRQLAAAPSPQVAQFLSQKLWDNWLIAPTRLAQDMLDTGMQLRLDGDLQGADTALSTLVEFCPNYAEGYNQRAFVRYLSGDFAKALPDLEQAIALRPRHLGAISGKGLTHRALGQSDLAAVEFQRMVDLNPWSPEAGFLKEQGEDL